MGIERLGVKLSQVFKPSGEASLPTAKPLVEKSTLKTPETRIKISDFHDSFYDSWHESYQWDGERWVFRDDGYENESGMMGAFNRSEYHRTRENLTEKERLAILKHYELTPEQVPLDKVPMTSPEYLEGILSQKK